MQLRAQIRLRGLNNVVELTGPLPQQEVIKRIQNAAVLAAPCVIGEDGNRDGLPTVLLEAMALGTPCVSADVTGIPELIQDGVTGLIVPQRNALDLSQRIGELLSDAALRIRLSKNARRLIERDFDIQHNSVALRTIFDSTKTFEARSAVLR